LDVVQSKTRILPLLCAQVNLLDFFYRDSIIYALTEWTISIY